MSAGIPPIPKNIDGSSQLFRQYSFRDALLFAPAFIVVVLGIVILPILIDVLNVGIDPAQFYPSVAGLAGLFGIGAIITLLTTPEHYDPVEWTKLHISHRLRASEYLHEEYAFDNDSRDPGVEQPHGFLDSAFSPNIRTQDVLGIERIYPAGDEPKYSHGAIQMDDDTLIGAIRVSPANLALSPHSEKRACANQLATVVNTTDYPIQMHYTTREFDIESFMDPFRQRLGDDDVRQSPQLQQLLDTFLDWYPAELRTQGTKKSAFYVVAGVEESEVRTTARSEGVTDQLADLPVFEHLISTDTEEEPEVVTRTKQVEKLSQRLANLESSLRQIEGVETTILDAEAHAGAISRAWKRDEYEPAGALQTTPIGMEVRN